MQKNFTLGIVGYRRAPRPSLASLVPLIPLAVALTLAHPAFGLALLVAAPNLAAIVAIRKTLKLLEDGWTF